MTLKYSCFISYRRDALEKKFIENLKLILKHEINLITNKNEVFLDKDTILYAQEFDLSIYDGIENSFFFIPLWYPQYLNEHNLWCARELYHAIELEKNIKNKLPNPDRSKFYFIIPLIYRGEAGDMPDCLSKKIAENISKLELPIYNNKKTKKLKEFTDKIFDALSIYYNTLQEYKDKIDFFELYKTVDKPTDDYLKNWILEQRKRIANKEAMNFPTLKLNSSDE